MTRRTDMESLDLSTKKTARRQCRELWSEFYPEAIDPLRVGLAAMAFETAMRKAVPDLRIEGDHDAIYKRLAELWVQTFDSELRRMAREDRP